MLTSISMVVNIKKCLTIEKKALEVAANASLSKSMSYRIYENGKALAELNKRKHGVILT